VSANRILVTGVNGQVGSELVQRLAALGEVVPADRKLLDLSSEESIRQCVREVKPRWIINPGAYTAVDKAESEPELAYAVNGCAPGILGEEAVRVGASVIHFSTDYVFSGEGDRAWKESDEPAPINVYGASKLAGEQALAASGAPHFIFRTSWVYGATGKNFLLTILKLAVERTELKIVADQHGTPTWSRNLADLTAHTLKLVQEKAGAGTHTDVVRDIGGIYHATDRGDTTWFGFAEHFVARAREMNHGKPYAKIMSIATTEYPTPAKRPKNSILDGTRLRNALGISMPLWSNSVDTLIDGMHGQI
jgi:dTDP-4-dehydrorhamnose reductase